MTTTTRSEPDDGPITVISGGVGAARFLRGLIDAVDPDRITAVVNTGDDTVLHGLSISPDLDTITYTLAEAIDPERGWGLVDETWRAMAALGRYVAVRPEGSAAAPQWFNLGDQDLATHFYRTARLAEGATLTEVTDEIRRAWDVPIRLVPMSDERCSTIVSVTEDPEAGGAGATCRSRTTSSGSATRCPSPPSASTGTPRCRRPPRPHSTSPTSIVIAPSNPLVSIGPLRSLPGVDDRLAERRDRRRRRVADRRRRGAQGPGRPDAARTRPRTERGGRAHGCTPRSRRSS